MTDRNSVRGVIIGAVLGMAVALPGTALAQEEPPLVNWPALLAPAGASYQPTSEDVCVSGRSQCVNAVIREMTRRNQPQLRSCDHDAVFALLYLRTTEEYRRYIEGPHNFNDVGFVNHEDAVFAGYYFRAYDDWHAGRRAHVPPAWDVAFEAAERGTVTGTGNLLLGMSAHINRDLPFVLAGIGLAQPDGTSRKPDHDTVNEFLNRVTPKALPEVGRRLDPTVDDASLGFTTADEVGGLTLVQTWREQAWRNAERLSLAPTPQARAQVATSIELYAEEVARGLADTHAYRPVGGEADRAARDAYCSAHWRDA